MMKKKSKIKETDLAKIVVDYLADRGWNIYQEVAIRSSGCAADIVAVNPVNEVFIIETKTSFNLDVMAQANHWLNRAHYCGVAVPALSRYTASNGRRFARTVCKRFGIGVLEVNGNGVFEKVKPTFCSNPLVDWNKHLTSYHKQGVAGSKSGGAITPYKVSIERIKEFLLANPGSSMNTVIGSLGKMHYASESSAKQALREALSRWESNWCVGKLDDTTRQLVYFIGDHQ